MSRVDLQGSNALEQTIKDLRTTLDGLKVKQRVGGAGLATFLSQNPGSFDIEALVSPGGFQSFPVTFTAAQQKNPFARLTCRVYLTNIRNEIHPDSPSWPRLVIRQSKADPDNQRATSWEVTIRGAATDSDYYIKWFVLASDVGVIRS